MPPEDDDVVVTEEVEELLGDEPTDEVVTKEQEFTDKYVANSIYGLVENFVNLPIFYFDMPVDSFRSGYFSTDPKLSRSDYLSLNEIVNDYRFNQFMPRQFRDRYRSITGLQFSGEELEQQMISLVKDMHEYFKEEKNFKYNIKEEAGSNIQVVQYRTKKTENGHSGIGAALGVVDSQGAAQVLTLDDVFNLYDGAVVNTQEATKEKAEETLKAEAEEAELSTAKTIVNNTQQYATNGLAWGFSTTVDGKVINPRTGEEEIAPFLKGDEYYDFLDLSEADIFRLQKRMVAAGMSPPTVDEYGEWTAREANFMAIVFTKATDDGTWDTDGQNGLPQYETALNDMITKTQETENYINMLYKDGYGVPKPRPTAGEVKSLLDEAARANGVILSEADYVNFANVVTQSMEKAAATQRAFDQAQITDKDLILNTNFVDPRAATPDKYGPGRMLQGSNLPLVLPSYEFLTQTKGVQPEVLNTQQLINDEIKKLKSRQIEGNQDLREIKYVANLFEQSMGQLTYGGAEET